MQKEYLRIGEIVRPQGIRGEVKLKRESQDEGRYAELRQVYFEEAGIFRPVRVLRGRANGDFAYLLLEGIGDRDEAEKLRGRTVYVDRAHAIRLPEGEHFICDLVGLRAETEDGAFVGTLTDVIQNPPAYDVYAFDTPRGGMMMPALRRVILEVDVQGGVMRLLRSGLEEVAVWEDEPAERDD